MMTSRLEISVNQKDRRETSSSIKGNQQSIGRIKAIIETSMSMYPEVFTDK